MYTCFVNLYEFCYTYVTQFMVQPHGNTMAVGVPAGRSGEGGRHLPPGKQWALSCHHCKSVLYNVVHVYNTCTTLQLGLIYIYIYN